MPEQMEHGQIAPSHPLDRSVAAAVPSTPQTRKASVLRPHMPRAERPLYVRPVANSNSGCHNGFHGQYDGHLYGRQVRILPPPRTQPHPHDDGGE